MAEKLTPAERETLLTLRDGPIYPNRGESWPVLVMLDNHGLAEEIDGTFVLTDAGRAALAAQAEPTRPADAPDPAAWAALLRVSGAYDEMPGTFAVRRNRDGQWVVVIRPALYRSPAIGMAADLSTAIRAAVAQAEGREGGSCVN